MPAQLSKPLRSDVRSPADSSSHDARVSWPQWFEMLGPDEDHRSLNDSP